MFIQFYKYVFCTKKAAVSYFLHKDIFAAKVLNFRVRDGIGCVHLAITAARYAI